MNDAGPAVPQTATGLLSSKLRQRGKNSIFFVTDLNEIDPAVSAKSIDKRVECISDNAIAAFNAGVASISHKTSATFLDTTISLFETIPASYMHYAAMQLAR